MTPTDHLIGRQEDLDFLVKMTESLYRMLEERHHDLMVFFGNICCDPKRWPIHLRPIWDKYLLELGCKKRPPIGRLLQHTQPFQRMEGNNRLPQGCSHEGLDARRTAEDGLEMNDKIYELLKKRLNDIFDLHIKAMDDPHRWPVRLDRLWLEYLEEIGCSVHHNHVRMIKSLPKSEEFVFCHNPMMGRTPGGLERVSVPKKLALKAIVLGGFPEFSLSECLK